MKATKWIPETVDEYLDALPEHVQITLAKVRKAIKAAVPKAEEIISYQIPVFIYNGSVAAFAAYKKHCSYFTMSHSIMNAFKDELRSYDTSGVTIHFPPDKPLPAALIKKLVMAKMKENEARMADRKNKLSIKKSNTVKRKAT